MSTTVSYKGSVIGVVENESKKLDTAGMWLEADVIITDVSSGGGTPTLETVTKTYTPSTSQQTETITPSTGYDGIGEVDVTVNAMPSGTLGTPLAVKGAVSNHTMEITPVVATQAGYIATQSKTGTVATVFASELDSGTKTISANGTGIDVVGYAAVDVNVSTQSGYTLEQINAVGFPAMTETSVVMGTATTLRPYTFRGNTSITSFSGANITDTKGDGYGAGAESHTFQNCTNLVSASLPKVKDLYHTDYIFSGCTKLQTCEMDWMNMTRLGTGVFQGCSALQKTSFVLPKLASNVYGYFISANPNLTAFDIGSASINMGNYNVSANAFNGDSNLSIFVIRCTNRVYSLANVSAFTNTPFANGKAGGTLYVPNSLIASYQSATNWVTILGYANNQIKSIESTATDPDAPIDLTTHYIDGTLIPT